MKKIKYTPDAADKLRNIKKEISQSYGQEVAKNYVFYRIEEQYIRVINIYNEREDFMWQLFGIDTIS